jgi:hypothetical protein
MKDKVTKLLIKWGNKESDVIKMVEANFDKAELMRATRANRKKSGLVELRLWLTPEQKERVKKYVARIKRAV